MRKNLIALGITICILLAAPLAFAASISFTSGDFDQYSIGGYDEVWADGFSDNFDIEPGTPSEQEVNYGYFYADTNSYTGNYGPFDAIRTFVVNGVSGNISQPFYVTIDIDADTHTLYLYDGPTVSFDLGSLGILNVTPLGIGELVVNYGGDESEGELYARFDLQPVPEPGTMMLLGSGLIGLAGYGRRRMKK